MQTYTGMRVSRFFYLHDLMRVRHFQGGRVRASKHSKCDMSDLCSAVFRAGEDAFLADLSERSARVALLVDGLTEDDAALLAEGAS
jgi:hypothetical protein